MTSLIGIEFPVQCPIRNGSVFQPRYFDHSSLANVRITREHGSSPLLAAGYLPAGRPTCIMLAEMTVISTPDRVCCLTRQGDDRSMTGSQRVKLKRVKHRLRLTMRVNKVFPMNAWSLSQRHALPNRDNDQRTLYCGSTHIYTRSASGIIGILRNAWNRDGSST